MTTLEISRLIHGGKLELEIPVVEWIQKALKSLKAKSSFMDHSVAIESYLLPGNFHHDPADRMLVATARIQTQRLMTADQRILDYPNVSTINASI